MKKLKVGMVGMGFIADWHYQGFQEAPNADIVGMSRTFFGNDAQQASQRQALQEKCAACGIKAYDSIEAMMEDPDIDALVIGSINPYHYEQILAAVRHGKHVLVEKPLVTDFEQLEELEKLSKQTDLKIMPAHNFVYRGAVQKAKALLDAGKLGQIIHSSFVMTHTISETHATGWRARKEIAKGGALIDSGHHLLYQALYLLGKPAKMQAFTFKMALTQMDCEDTAQVSLLYPDGSMAMVMQSWASNHGDTVNGIRILGTEGSIEISDGLYVNGHKLDADVDYAESFQNQANAFANYIQEGTPPLSGLQDVRDTLSITFGAYESNEQDKVISENRQATPPAAT